MCGSPRERITPELDISPIDRGIMSIPPTRGNLGHILEGLFPNYGCMKITEQTFSLPTKPEGRNPLRQGGNIFEIKKEVRNEKMESL